MRIYDLLEELNLDRANLNDDSLWIVYEEYTTEQWAQAGLKYLESLDCQHRVPGKVVHTLQGICDYYRENQSLTPRQGVWLVANLIRYWNQMSCQARADLAL